MATSSTSITIKWANSKIAETLRKREEEEALLRGNRVRHRDDSDGDRKKSRRTARSAQPDIDMPITSRWSGRVDYSKPSPLKERPRSETGATSFHFKVTQISKEVSPTISKNPIAGFSSGSGSPGADHELYIGRELATERALSPDDIEAYIGRAGAVEIDDDILVREPGRAYHDDVDEGIDELDLAVDASGVPSIFSNISGDAFERAEFWKAVHRCEREPRVQTILIDATKDPSLVRRMMSDEALPASFREMAALAYEDASRPRDVDAERVRPRIWQGDAEACGKVLSHLQSYDGFDARRSGISYKSGRGGTVQHRLVAELPHELTAAERAQLVIDFCHHLETIEKSDDGSTRGLMYTAAIHAPDAHNDARNYHLHVVFHDRPARIVQGFGMWDFEIAEAFDRKGEVRTRYPFRQEKLRMVRGLDDKSDPEVSGRNFIPGLRREFSRITNEALERAGIERRYDPRTYKAMGIERTPTEHLGTKAAALEAAGVETTVGSLNAAKIWQDAEAEVARKAKRRKDAIAKREAELVALLADGAQEPSASEATTKLRTAVADWTRAAVDVIEDRELIEGFDLFESKARSRAEKVRDTCLRTLADIQLGTARAQDVKAKAQIDKRYDDAEMWLVKIDYELDEKRADIGLARKQLARDEERVVDLSRNVDTLAEELRKLLAAARSSAAKSAARAKPQAPAKAAAPAQPVPPKAPIQTAAPVQAPMPPQAAQSKPGAPDKPVDEYEIGMVDISLFDTKVPPSKSQADVSASTPVASPAAPTINQPGASKPPQVTSPAAPEVGQPDASKRPMTAAPATPTVKQPDASKPPLAAFPAAPPTPQPDLSKQQPAASSVGETVKPTPSETRSDQQQDASKLASDKTAESAKQSNVEAPSAGQAVPQETPPVVPSPPVPSPVESDKGASEPVPHVGTRDTKSSADPASTGSGQKPPKRDDNADRASTKTMSEDVKTSPQPAPKQAPAQPAQPEPEQAPALFDLAEQRAPVKQGSVAEREQKWNDLFDRIQAENLFILPGEGERTGKLDVPSLDEKDRALLDTPELMKRTQARLGALKNNQDHGVRRLGKWLDEHGHDETKLLFNERSYRYRDTPQAIQTLLEKYRSHPTITPQLEKAIGDQKSIRRLLEWFRTEGRDPAKLVLQDGTARLAESAIEARQDMARVGRTKPIKDALRAEYEQRQRELEAKNAARPSDRSADSTNGSAKQKIDIDKLRNNLVQVFAKGLNDGLPPEKLHEVAKRIAINRSAREELAKLGQWVGVAYTRASNLRPDSKAPDIGPDRERGGRDF